MWKGGSEQQKMRQKHKEASSRRLVFVGRLHTSATSPLMKASRNGSKQAPAPVPAPGSKGRARGSQKGLPDTNSSSKYINKPALGAQAVPGYLVLPRIQECFFRKYMSPVKTNHYKMNLLYRKHENQVLPQKPRSDW